VTLLSPLEAWDKGHQRVKELTIGPAVRQNSFDRMELNTKKEVLKVLGRHLFQCPTKERAATIRATLESDAKDRAKVVGMGAWYDQPEKALTEDEKAGLRAYWDTLPGNSSLVSSFLLWIKGGE